MKSSKKIALLSNALVIALFVSLTPQASAATSDATINIGSLFEPQNLSNYGGGGQGITQAFNNNVYEGLFRLTDDGKVENLIADSYSLSRDRLTYTIKIKSGIKFHSGKALTSADVSASVFAVTSAASKSARKSSFVGLASIATPNDATVVFTLKAPSISFTYNLSYVWIVDSSKTDITTTEDGTGPYTLDKWTRGSSLSLKRFDKYWGTPAKNAEAVFKYFTDATALNNALLSGQIDIISSLQSPDALKGFEARKDLTISNGASTTKLLLAFNDKVAPFNNVNVRKAVYSAINRQKLLQSIWGSYGTLIGSMVPPTDPWYIDLKNKNPYSINIAKRFLKKAGLEKGFTFTLDSPTYDPHPVVAAFIKSELAKVGITVIINPISADTWYSKVFKARDFQATLQEHVNHRDIVWYGNPNFYWGYSNPQVTQWVAEAEAARTFTAQTNKLKLVNRQIAADAASAWLYLYPQIVVAKNNVTGYQVNGLNSQFFVFNIVKA